MDLRPKSFSTTRLTRKVPLYNVGRQLNSEQSFAWLEGEEPIIKEKLSWLQQKMFNKGIKKKCQNLREPGYSSINGEDLLACLLTYRWRKQTHLSVKDCRKDIQRVKPNEFFDYQQLLAQTSKEPLGDWHDIEDSL